MGKEELDCFRQLGPSGRTLTPASNIGINTLPDQFVNIELTKGFTFNLMCVGVSGIGKTTLLRSLFRINLQDDSHPTRSNDVLLTERELSLSEASVSLRVKLIESRGFGDQINKSDNSRNVVKYIEEKFESYYREESRVCRQLDKVGDGLVHACIYMLEPTGASLSTLDIITLKELQTRVNVILVIGKSDSLTPSELKDFKKRIMEELLEKGVELYKCPTDDPTVSTKNCELNLHIPFAVVASTEEMLINNQLCRVRKYPWGSVNVDDESHCEFTHLREALLRNNLYHLIRTTHSKFFYRFRAEQLSKDKPTGDSLMAKSVECLCMDVRKSNESQLQVLQLEYDNHISSLYDKFKTEEESLKAKYMLKIQELEDQKQRILDQSVFYSSCLSFESKTWLLAESTTQRTDGKSKSMSLPEKTSGSFRRRFKGFAKFISSTMRRNRRSQRRYV